MKIKEQKLPIGLGAKGDVVEVIQFRLIAAGADLRPDRDYGTITADAVRAFQARSGLHPTGFVGPKTAAALDKIRVKDERTAAPSVIKIAPWLSTMRAITGTKEFAGAADNPIILSWREAIGRFPRHRQYVKSYGHDAIAWCGLTVAYCLAANNIDPVKNFLWALNWSKTNGGELIKLDKPVPGAILSFSRAGGGHVAMYESETPTHWVIRGGNQGDMVSLVQRRKGSDLKGIMWPAGYDVKGKPVLVSTSDAKLAGSEA